jgi:hypothetical protein
LRRPSKDRLFPRAGRGLDEAKVTELQELHLLLEEASAIGAERVPGGVDPVVGKGFLHDLGPLAVFRLRVNEFPDRDLDPGHGRDDASQDLLRELQTAGLQPAPLGPS